MRRRRNSEKFQPTQAEARRARNLLKKLQKGMTKRASGNATKLALVELFFQWYGAELFEFTVREIRAQLGPKRAEQKVAADVRREAKVATSAPPVVKPISGLYARESRDVPMSMSYGGRVYRLFKTTQGDALRDWKDSYMNYWLVYEPLKKGGRVTMTAFGIDNRRAEYGRAKETGLSDRVLGAFLALTSKIIFGDDPEAMDNAGAYLQYHRSAGTVDLVFENMDYLFELDPEAPNRAENEEARRILISRIGTAYHTARMAMRSPSVTFSVLDRGEPRELNDGAEIVVEPFSFRQWEQPRFDAEVTKIEGSATRRTFMEGGFAEWYNLPAKALMSKVADSPVLSQVVPVSPEAQIQISQAAAAAANPPSRQERAVERATEQALRASERAIESQIAQTEREIEAAMEEEIAADTSPQTQRNLSWALEGEKPRSKSRPPSRRSRPPSRREPSVSYVIWTPTHMPWPGDAAVQEAAFTEEDVADLITDTEYSPAEVYDSLEMELASVYDRVGQEWVFEQLPPWGDQQGYAFYSATGGRVEIVPTNVGWGVLAYAPGKTPAMLIDPGNPAVTTVDQIDTDQLLFIRDEDTGVVYATYPFSGAAFHAAVNWITESGRVSNPAGWLLPAMYTITSAVALGSSLYELRNSLLRRR